MKLTVNDINAATKILSGIKFNRITDKEAKSALLKDYLILRKAAKEAEEDKNEIVRKFQEDWMDELAQVEAFRKEKKPVVGHDEYLDAERDANKAIVEIWSRELDIDLVSIPQVAITDFSEDITLEQIAFLQEAGIIGE